MICECDAHIDMKAVKPLTAKNVGRECQFSYLLQIDKPHIKDYQAGHGKAFAAFRATAAWNSA